MTTEGVEIMDGGGQGDGSAFPLVFWLRRKIGKFPNIFSQNQQKTIAKPLKLL
jgi:hypothetical protein